jgi:hypothetical protein
MAVVASGCTRVLRAVTLMAVLAATTRAAKRVPVVTVPQVLGMVG